MSNTLDADDRRKALDAFAETPNTPSMVPTVLPMQSPADRVFGAQKVAVYRDETRILQKLAALGAAAGDDWFYRFPVKNKREDRTDWIEGPSIKLANDVARIYGNCDVDTRVIDLGDSWLIYARFTDFESGYSLTRPFQQRKGAGKIGGRGDDADARRLDISFQIGVSKAIRNVVVNALQTFSDYAFAEARNSLVDKIGKNIDGWRDKTLKAIDNLGVDVKRVEKVIGRPVKDWLAPDIARVIAMGKAITDGMATVDDSFPPLDAIGDSASAQSQPAQDQRSASSQSPAGAAAGEAASAQSSKSSSSQGSTAPSADAGAADADKNADAATPEKKETKAGKKTEPDFQPDSEASYTAHANAWREKATDPVAAMAQWKTEKNLRNKCNVAPEVRDDLLAKLQAKCAHLQQAEG